MSEITTIQLQKSTVAALREIGVMGQTYDDVLQQLIEEHREMGS